MKPLTRLTAACTIALASAAPAAADDHRDADFRQLSAQWWQWALSIPTPSNPLLDPTKSGDTTAVNCMVGQRGPVWFLAGTFTGGFARRTCSVPAGVTLFFPVLNTVVINTPKICGQGDPQGVAELRTLLAPFIDAGAGLEAKLDNKPVRGIRRVRSVPFAVAFPIDNIFLGICNGDSPPGVFSPAVDDGYYAQIKGLEPGVHTLEIHATSGAFVLDVAYVLNVVAVADR